ncbi:hypothetical protein [Paracoccus fontiphilus]|uniref:Uncharacterized protein n=1 Tax=Paracoccus fontiphilus TaxID=1815556 RepID=A0ABV7IF43_9RHOB|nr:hypothetical protein [Paracoccus fontiphilus]
MALLDDINLILRDHVGYSGDGQGGNGALPVGDRSTARHSPDLRDWRELLATIAQAMGDPAALQNIITQLGGKANAANATKVFSSRAAAVSAGQAAIDAGIGSIFTREGTDLVVRGRTAEATDPLFETGDRWGIVLRLPGSNAFDAALAAAIAGVLAQARQADAEVLTVAALADERAQKTEKRLDLTAERFDALIARIGALEENQNAQEQSEMTAYSLAATAGTSASVLVAAGPVTDLKLVNKSGTATVGIKFGTAPAGLGDAGVLPLGPGGALDLDTIPATPIHVIASDTADIVGSFSVPLHEPNPNWETDFQAIITRMVAAGADTPNLAWQDAYRRLYSALRRENILSRMGGLFVLATHGIGAGRVNWAGTGTMSVGGGAPAFVAKRGYAFDGNDYFDSGVNLNAFGLSPTQASALVWAETTSPAGGQAAAGDGGFELLPTLSASSGGARSWSPDTAVDTLTGLNGVGFVGITRAAPDRFTLYGPGAAGEVKTRSALGFVPARTFYVGATNSSTGVGKFYNGTIRAVMAGHALNAVQVLAAQAALSRYFKQIEAL